MYTHLALITNTKACIYSNSRRTIKGSPLSFLKTVFYLFATERKADKIKMYFRELLLHCRE